jgi:hypothetical protein
MRSREAGSSCCAWSTDKHKCGSRDDEHLLVLLRVGLLDDTAASGMSLTKELELFLLTWKRYIDVIFIRKNTSSYQREFTQHR